MEEQLWLPLYFLSIYVVIHGCNKKLPQGALFTVGGTVNWYGHWRNHWQSF